MLIKYEVGDMFLSNADCLINTVNCEGYMGKGIAYQFKLKFPENNKDYVKACKSGKLHVGTLHFFEEDGVMIINFPTKDRWREKSRMSYIETGLDRIVELLPQLSVKTIAIPPLGCGNGGLNWQEVKKLIEEKLSPIQEKYFKFEKYKYGPFAYSIDILSKNIREYQNYYGIQNMKDTYQMVYRVLCSNKTDKKLEELNPAIKRAVSFVNEIEEDKRLEGTATALFLIEQSANDLSKEEVVDLFKNWSEDKADRFLEQEIVSYIDYLEKKGIIEKNILGFYQLSEYI